MEDIDIGSAAINRSNWQDYGVSFIVKENPANASGRITSVDVWFKSSTSGAWVATFYPNLTPPNTFTARDRQWIGPITGGVKETFEVDLAVGEGNYIGIFFGLEGQIEADESGEGIWARVGDIYTWEKELFTFIPNITISLGGAGLVTSSTKTLTGTLTMSGGLTKKLKLLLIIRKIKMIFRGDRSEYDIELEK
jgi:hypothetical protein